MGMRKRLMPVILPDVNCSMEYPLGDRLGHCDADSSNSHTRSFIEVGKATVADHDVNEVYHNGSDTED